MMNALDFILFIKDDVESHGYSIKILDAKFIDTGDNAPSSGYFSEENKELVACLKSASFIEILAHEYCHFRQTIEDKSLWESSEICYNNIFEWLDGKKIMNIDKNIDGCIALELDCEKRAYNLLKKWGFETENYIRKANAYIYFWKYLRLTRKWCHPFNSPSQNDNILYNMPDQFQKDYTLTKKLKSIFKKEYI
jgi:hypothetical protein